MASSPGLVSADELATALKVLRAAAPPYDASKSSHVDVEGSEVVALRKLLMPAIHTILKRERHRQRQAAKAQATHGQSEAKTEGDGTTERLDALSKVESGDGVVKLDATVLSRPLYACPVCFLSTWLPSGKRNLMTISWLSPLDNDGHFTLSVNARRHSAQMLARNPTFVLSVAHAGLEQLLLRCGSCTGAKLSDKALSLGVPLCQPGWRPLSPASTYGSTSSVPLAEVEDEPTACTEGPAWSADVDGTPAVIPIASEHELQGALSGAFAVEPCVAHIVARIAHARQLHGHLQLTCETLMAFARTDYWSGKTLEQQHADLPPLLSFVGSQRFAHVHTATRAERPKAEGTIRG